MSIRSIIFDLDGTLINSLDDLAHSVNIMLESYGLPTWSVNDYRYKVGNGAKKLVERSLPPEKAQDENFVAEALARYKQIYESHTADTTRPYDGIIDTLTKLTNVGVKISICTNKPQIATEIVARNMLAELDFAKIMGDKEGFLPKPDPRKVQIICEELNISPSDTAFVGDSAVDMETAVNSGCLPVGVLWGFRDREELTASGAEILLARPEELLEKLEF